MPKHVVTIKDTHRGLMYEDGVLKRVLEAGSYEVRPPNRWLSRPLVEIDLVTEMLVAYAAQVSKGS